MNPDLDLALQRVIRAPLADVWNAWTDPRWLERWWLPAPAHCKVERLEAKPGGAFVTRMSDDGVHFVPHLDACFLVVDPLQRLVFTNAVDSEWRPAAPDPVSMTAEIMMADHRGDTDYRVTVRHADPAARKRHEDLGFAEGWGSVTDQLAALVEQRGGRSG